MALIGLYLSPAVSLASFANTYPFYPSLSIFLPPLDRSPLVVNGVPLFLPVHLLTAGSYLSFLLCRLALSMRSQPLAPYPPHRQVSLLALSLVPVPSSPFGSAFSIFPYRFPCLSAPGVHFQYKLAALHRVFHPILSIAAVSKDPGIGTGKKD